MFEKQVFFGMYCLMSPFTFSIALSAMMSTDRQNRPLFQCSLQSFRGMRIPFRCQLWTGRVCPLLRFISREMVDGLTFIALAMSFFFVPFWSKIKIVYLCSEVNCLYICNAKLINLWETAVSLFVFLALLVEFSSDGGFSPPNPSVFSGIRLNPFTLFSRCNNSNIKTINTDKM